MLNKKWCAVGLAAWLGTTATIQAQGILGSIQPNPPAAPTVVSLPNAPATQAGSGPRGILAQQPATGRLGPADRPAAGGGQRSAHRGNTRPEDRGRGRQTAGGAGPWPDAAAECRYIAKLDLRRLRQGFDDQVRRLVGRGLHVSLNRHGTEQHRAGHEPLRR